MKKLILLALGTAASLSLAAPKLAVFHCQTKLEGKTYKVDFQVSNLGDAKAIRLEPFDGAEESDGPVRIRPQNSPLSVLNDQGGDIRLGADRIRLFGDGDGVDYVDLVLFKNSGYTQGYVRTYGDGAHLYGKISCTRK